MNVERAPNTADLIWDNVSIPDAQIMARQSIAGFIYGIDLDNTEPSSHPKEQTIFDEN